jgi:hypothetical protein
MECHTSDTSPHFKDRFSEIRVKVDHGDIPRHLCAAAKSNWAHSATEDCRERLSAMNLGGNRFYRLY